MGINDNRVTMDTYNAQYYAGQYGYGHYQDIADRRTYIHYRQPGKADYEILLKCSPSIFDGQ